MLLEFDTKSLITVPYVVVVANAETLEHFISLSEHV